MPLPSNDKQVGDIGHADDHNAIVNEINSLIAASVNYLAVSASNNFLPMAASANYLPLSASNDFLPMAASANYLPLSASNDFLLISSSITLANNITSIIVDAAPATLDTLNELAAALGDDVNFSTSTASALGQRLTTENASAIYLSKLDAALLYLSVSSSSNYLPISASSNYLPISASSNYLPMGASSNFATVTISTNAQTGTSYTLAASDSAKIIEMNNAAANLVIIPLNATVPFPIGTQIEVVQTGAGATSASIVSGVTLNSESGKRTINAQWQGASLIKRGTDSWMMIGAIKA